VLVDKTTNRLTGSGFTYDAAGNLTATPGNALVLSYDGANRVVQATSSMYGTQNYGYGPDNRRVWDGAVYLYGAEGEELGRYTTSTSGSRLILNRAEETVYFLGRRVRPAKFADRLGTEGRVYPYGENGGRYATYRQDGTTGLHYALNRYYHSGFGRFTSADPYVSPAALANPQGWNRYAYVEGDPVNKLDPAGLMTTTAEEWARCAVAFHDGPWLWVCGGIGTNGGPGSAGYVPRQPTAESDRGGGSELVRSFIRVTNPSKTGPNQDRIRAVMTWMRQNIDPTCEGWLSGLGDAIAGLLGDATNLDTVAIGHGAFDTRTVSAFTGNNPSQTDLPAGYAIAVNDVGAFFVGSYVQNGASYTLSANGYGGGTSQAQVAILLHELAHFLVSAGLGAVGFQPDFDDSAAGAANDRLVRQNCQRTLDAARNIP